MGAQKFSRTRRNSPRSASGIAFGPNFLSLAWASLLLRPRSRSGSSFRAEAGQWSAVDGRSVIIATAAPPGCAANGPDECQLRRRGPRWGSRSTAMSTLWKPIVVSGLVARTPARRCRCRRLSGKLKMSCRLQSTQRNFVSHRVCLLPSKEGPRRRRLSGVHRCPHGTAVEKRSPALAGTLHYVEAVANHRCVLLTKQDSLFRLPGSR